jgi:hypothetical protein
MNIVRKFLKRLVPPQINVLLHAGYSIESVRDNLAALRTGSLLASERAQDPKRLLRCGFKGYSQSDEDGILQEIFRRIGVVEKTFVEFGVGFGTENNTLYLLFSGWRGLWIEADHSAVMAIGRRLSGYIRGGQLTLLEEFVDKDNIDSLLRGGGFEGEIDLLSIDISGNDYWVWKATSAVNPRVLCVEYNATFRPPVSLVVEYRRDYRWDGTNHFGASLKALEELGSEKGYALVGCCLAGVNAFFVRKDLVQDRFCAPFTAENHYEPARHSLFLPEPNVHPPGLGMYKCVGRERPPE